MWGLEGPGAEGHPGKASAAGSGQRGAGKGGREAGTTLEGVQPYHGLKSGAGVKPEAGFPRA